MDEELDDLWKKLYVYIDRIYNCDTLSCKEKMTFHSLIFKYCSCTSKNVSEHPQRRGRHLYSNFKEFFKFHLREYVSELESISNYDELMEKYVACWERYRNASALLDGLSRYMNRNWLPEELKNSNDAYPAYRLALITFKDLLLDAIDNPLISAVSESIEKTHNEELIDNELVCKVMESLVELYFNDKNERQTITVTKKMENVFEADCLQFYEINSHRVFKKLINDDKYDELKKRFQYLFLYFEKCCIELSQIMKENLDRNLDRIFKGHKDDRLSEKYLNFYLFFSEYSSKHLKDKTESLEHSNFQICSLSKYLEMLFNEQKAKMDTLQDNSQEIIRVYLEFCAYYEESLKKLDNCYKCIDQTWIEDNQTKYNIFEWCMKKWNEFTSINKLIANAIFQHFMESGPSDFIDNFRKHLKQNKNLEASCCLKSIIGSDIEFQLNNVIPGKKNCLVFMRNILNVFESYDELLWSIFPNEPDFWITSKTLKKFIKKNKSEEFSDCDYWMAAKFCDLLLRNPMENHNNHLMRTLPVLEYFDNLNFWKTYSRFQEYRLFNSTVSIDNEILFIQLMEKMCGTDTNDEELQNMRDRIADLKSFREINAIFRKQNLQQCGEFINITLLTETLWKQSNKSKWKLPKQLSLTFDLFESFFSTYDLKRPPKRNIRWDLSISTGEIEMKINGNSYTLFANTYQLIILLQFNDQNSYTLKELMEKCGCNLKDIIFTLQTLIKAKLLTIDNSIELSEQSTVHLCLDYNNTKNYIDITSYYELENLIEKPKLLISRDANGYIPGIRSQLNRVMKRERTMYKQNLTNEVKNNNFWKLYKNIDKVLGEQIKYLIQMNFLEEQEFSYKYVP